jgi:hypothetical protein
MSIILAALGVLLLAAGAAAQVTMQFSGDITVPRDTVQQGSAITMNGRITVEGTLRGDAMTMNGDIRVNGTVTGDVRTFNGHISLGPTAVVGGDVWTANGTVYRAPGAEVGGRVRAETAVPQDPTAPTTPGSPQGPLAPAQPVPPQPVPPSQMPGPMTPPPSMSPAPPMMPGPTRPWDGMPYPSWSRVARAMATATLLGFVVLAVLVTAIFPRPVRGVASALSTSPGEALLAGAAIWIILPPLAVVLALSIVGIPAVVMLPFIVALVGVVGIAGVAVVVGERIIGAFQRDRSEAIDALVGAALLGVLAFLPVIGWLAILLAVTWGLGAVILLLFRRVRGPGRPPVAPPATPA